jgi:tetratricopeptide (TPR) repeat protein
VRLEAVESFTARGPEDFINTLSPLLNDPVKVVRIQAANRISTISKESLSEDQIKLLEQVLEEYLETLKYSADFPAGRFNLGNFYSQKGDYANAENQYNKAIEIDSLFYPAKSNLAMLYYNNGKLNEAENLFLDLIKNHPEYTDGNYFLGLLYAEQKQYKESAEQLEIAATKTENNIRIYYNLGLIYQQLNKTTKAESSLLKGYSTSPNDFDIMYALVDFYVKRGDNNHALQFATEINQKFPSNPTGQQLIDYIQKQIQSN